MKPKSRKCSYCMILGSKTIIKDQKICCCHYNKHKIPRKHRSLSTYKKNIHNISHESKHNYRTTAIQKQNQKPFDTAFKSASQNQQYKDILIQNTHLKIQNSKLKQNIENSSNRLHQIKISDFSTQLMSNQTILQDKLYQSNKCLQEAILNLNQQQKINKLLEQKITELTAKDNQYRIDRQFLKQKINKYKSKLKDYAQKLRRYQQNQTLNLGTERHNENLAEKCSILSKINVDLQIRIQQLQRQLNFLNSNNCRYPNKQEHVWIKKATDKINNIQQNISIIEQNNSQILNMKNQIYEFKKKNKCEFNMILSCQDYLISQLDINFDYKFQIGQNIKKYTKQFTFFKELKQISENSNYNHIKQLIQKLDITQPLVHLINGIINSKHKLFQQVLSTIQQKLNQFQNKHKTIQKKLLSLSKLIAIIHVKRKSQKTHKRYLSKLEYYDENKQNMVNYNNNFDNMQSQSKINNSKTLFMRIKSHKQNQKH